MAEQKHPQPGPERLSLKDYHELQKAGRHHDALLWKVSAMLLSAIMILMGLVIDVEATGSEILLSVAAGAGLVGCVLLWLLARDFRRIKKEYFDKSNTLLDNLETEGRIDSRARETLRSPARGGQWELYTLLLVVLAVLWGVVFCHICHVCF